MEWWKKAGACCWGLAATFGILVVLSLLSSAVLYFSSLPESAAAGLAIAINALALAGGGFVAAKKAGEKGLLMGAAVALIMLLLMAVADSHGPEAQPLVKAAYCSVSALCGGVFGVR